MRSRVHAINQTNKAEEYRLEAEEATKIAESAERELKNVKHKYEDELVEIKRNHEQKVSI